MNEIDLPDVFPERDLEEPEPMDPRPPAPLSDAELVERIGSILTGHGIFWSKAKENFDD